MSMAQTGSLAGVMAACAASFGIALYLRNAGEQPAVQEPAPALVASAQQTATAGGANAAKPTSPEKPAADDSEFGQTAKVTNPSALGDANSGVNGPWRDRSGYGIPNPRWLSDREKKALSLLGGVQGIYASNFGRTLLDDGSTVPGVPPLESDEVRKRLLEKVNAKGLSIGFEEFIREIAIQNPRHFAIRVTGEAKWADVQKVLGDTQLVDTSSPGTVFAINWYNIGEVEKGDWLSFGVGTTGQVNFVRATFPVNFTLKSGTAPADAPLIPAELVPGGRSPPDPAKGKKTGKGRDLSSHMPHHFEPRSHHRFGLSV